MIFQAPRTEITANSNGIFIKVLASEKKEITRTVAKQYSCKWGMMSDLRILSCGPVSINHVWWYLIYKWRYGKSKNLCCSWRRENIIFIFGTVSLQHGDIYIENCDKQKKLNFIHNNILIPFSAVSTKPLRRSSTT